MNPDQQQQCPSNIIISVACMYSRIQNKLIRNKVRTLSNPNLRANQRLNFPIKQLQLGSFGKKQFGYKNQDSVVLQSPEAHKFIRKDKLDIADIEGAKPKSIPFPSVELHRRSSEQRVSQVFEQKIERLRTQCREDSLDRLMKIRTEADERGSPKIAPIKYSYTASKDQEKPKPVNQTQAQLSKLNILGIYPENPEKFMNSLQSKPVYRNPTHLSSFMGLQ